MANATTLIDRQGNKLYPRTKASLSLMENGVSVEAEINNLKEKTRYNKGHFSTPEALNSAYPSTNPDGTTISDEDSVLREGWYAIVGSTDTVWIWDVQGKEWVNSGTGASLVDSVNGETGEVILTGEDINATATVGDTSVTKTITGHLNDIYNELEDTVTLDGDQVISGTKTFTNVIGLLNEDAGQVDQIKHINNNFLITSGTGENLLNIDEGLETVSAFNRQLAFEDEIEQIQGHYVSYDQQTGKTEAQKAQARANIGAGTSDIDTVKVNGVAQPIENGSVNITLPSTTDALPILKGANIWDLEPGWYLLSESVIINNKTYNIWAFDSYNIPSQLLTYVSVETYNPNYVRNYRTLMFLNAQKSSAEDVIYSYTVKDIILTVYKTSEDQYNEIWEDYPHRIKGSVVTNLSVVNDTLVVKKDDTTINLSEIATKNYVSENGGKIDTIKVNGVEQTITNKEVDLNVVESEDYLESTGVENPLDNYFTKSQIIDMVCPVGKYMYYPESPAEKWGGVWEQVSGKFLFASDDVINEDGSITQGAYPLGSVGGETTHTLTTNEIPAHNHYERGYASTDKVQYRLGYGSGSTWGLKNINLSSNETGGIYAGSLTTENAGGGQPHSIMPPYITGYLWLRIE